MVLADDLDNNGHMELVAATMNGNVYAFQTAAEYHPLKSWTSAVSDLGVCHLRHGTVPCSFSQDVGTRGRQGRAHGLALCPAGLCKWLCLPCLPCTLRQHLLSGSVPLTVSAMVTCQLAAWLPAKRLAISQQTCPLPQNTTAHAASASGSSLPAACADSALPPGMPVHACQTFCLSAWHLAACSGS